MLLTGEKETHNPAAVLNSGYSFLSAPKSSDEESFGDLFVALTRAEKYLSISYSKYRNDNKELEPSKFIAEIQDTHDLPVEKVFIDEQCDY